MCFGKESLVLEPEDDNDNENKINDDVCLWFQLLELDSNNALYDLGVYPLFIQVTW